MNISRSIGILAAGLAMFALPTMAMAQSKETTAAWILGQMPNNPQGLSHAIENGHLISRIRFYTLRGDSMVEKTIPLSRVTHITYVHTPEYLSYSLTCDAPCAYLLDEPDLKQSKFLFEIYRNLDSNFATRMNRALLHLIKTHGGSAKI